MTNVDQSPAAEIPRRYFWSLARWCWPYLRPFPGLLLGASIAALIVLSCQATIPLVISDILTPPTGGTADLLTLAALVTITLVMGYLAENAAYALSTRATTSLRRRVFTGLLNVGVLQRPHLYRSSVVSRHTSDVDNIAAAIDRTIAAGIPGVLQVVVSLILLTAVEPRAGAAMAVVIIGFLIVRARLGKRLLARDRARLDSSSHIGDVVDESITMSTQLAGLRLESWQQDRFDAFAGSLERATMRQHTTVSQLGTLGTAAGLLGLLVIMMSASAMGDFALIAAALLYINMIVTGLAALPPWVRDLQLAVVSRRRIDQVLVGAAQSAVLESTLATPSWRKLAADGCPQRGMIGLVTSDGLDDDMMLAALTGEPSPQSWRVTLFGQVIRRPNVRPDVIHVPDGSGAFNVSVRDHLRAVEPSITTPEVTALLAQVGLAHVDDLDEPLGSLGANLSAGERSRLLLAMAIAARPSVLLIGPMPAFSDVDTAAGLLSSLRRSGIETVVVAVRGAEVAADMDALIFASTDEVITGPHTQLLAESGAYSNLWTQRVLTNDVDLGAIGIDEHAQSSLHARLVTEQYSAGDIIYRESEPADRVLFIISGQVEISAGDRRVAVLGPGNHCGDLRLTQGQTRAESARALTDCVVKSLSRGAYTSGVMDLVERPRPQRRLVTELLRNGPGTATELAQRLPDGMSPSDVESAAEELLHDGVLRRVDGVLSVVQERRRKRGTDDLHARLLDL